MSLEEKLICWVKASNTKLISDKACGGAKDYLPQSVKIAATILPPVSLSTLTQSNSMFFL